jgi:hypothetical protein
MWFYLSLQQLLLHGWSAAACYQMRFPQFYWGCFDPSCAIPPCKPDHPATCEVHTVEEHMQIIVGAALHFITDEGRLWDEEADRNRQSTGWRQFQERMRAGAVTHNDVTVFCDEVLLSEIATLGLALEMNAGRDPRTGEPAPSNPYSNGPDRSPNSAQKGSDFSITALWLIARRILDLEEANFLPSRPIF